MSTTSTTATATLFRPLLYTASAIFDDLVIALHTWSIIRTALFCLHIVLVWSFAVKRHFEELNAALLAAVLTVDRKAPENSVAKMPLIQNQSPGRALPVLLDRFYREYHWLQAACRRADEQITSQLLFTGVAANLAVNLVLIGNFIFRSLPPVVTSLMVFIGLLQSVIAYTAASGLAGTSGCFYQSEGLLYRLQLKLTESTKCTWTRRVDPGGEGGSEQELRNRRKRRNVWILQKLKLAHFYEIVCTENKFCYTFGNLSNINHKTMYEFMYAYSGFVMYVSK